MTDTLAALAADMNAWLTKATANDHTPEAIFRRSRRAALANPEKARRWKARALDLDPAPLHNAIALSGMVPIMWDERWHLAVAVDQPSPCGGLLDPIADVVMIDPAANTAFVMGDAGREHVAPQLPRERLSVTTDAKAWARAIALDRLEWYHLRTDRHRMLQAPPTWIGDVPSALLLTSPRKVRWSDFHAKIIDVPADMRRDVERVVRAQAQLPRIEGRA